MLVKNVFGYANLTRGWMLGGRGGGVGCGGAGWGGGGAARMMRRGKRRHGMSLIMPAHRKWMGTGTAGRLIA